MLINIKGAGSWVGTVPATAGDLEKFNNSPGW